MGAQLRLPAALAARGLTVETVPGWETRSAGSFNPRGAVCHWTAGPKGTLKRPSLAICTHGRADLPGPLCNVYLTRDGVAVVVAAGRANHAGAGSWGGVTGNSSFFGTECEAAGPDDFTPAQRAAYPRVNAAFCDLGGFGADMVCGHSEYATPRGRKSDINGYTMADMRADVASVLAGQHPTSPLQEDDMFDPARDRATLENAAWLLGQMKPNTDLLPAENAQTDVLVWAANDIRASQAQILAVLTAQGEAIRSLSAGRFDQAAVEAVARTTATRVVAQSDAELGAHLTAMAELRQKAAAAIEATPPVPA